MLTGPACTEAMSEAEEAERRERAQDNAGGVRVERRVRRAPESYATAHSIEDCYLRRTLAIKKQYA